MRVTVVLQIGEDSRKGTTRCLGTGVISTAVKPYRVPPITRSTPPTKPTPAPHLETRAYGVRALSPNYRYCYRHHFRYHCRLLLHCLGKRLLTSFVGENRRKPAMAEGLKSTPAGRSAPPSARKMRTSRETSWGGVGRGGGGGVHQAPATASNQAHGFGGGGDGL